MDPLLQVMCVLRANDQSSSGICESSIVLVDGTYTLNVNFDFGNDPCKSEIENHQRL